MLTVSCRPGLINSLYIPNPSVLTTELKRWPRLSKILFVCWSWKVPNEILSDYDCFGMHTGPLLEGKGKGGSPIANLQNLHINWSTLCVFRMTEEIDSGHVMIAIPISLIGSESQIFKRIDDLIPSIREYLDVDNSKVPERFYRCPKPS